MASNSATLRRDGDALVFSGVLDRTAATALWPQAAPLLAGVARLDLRDVAQLDSAGLALLAELAERARAQRGQPVDVVGSPAGLDELRAAYRLSPTLDFQA